MLSGFFWRLRMYYLRSSKLLGQFPYLESLCRPSTIDDGRTSYPNTGSFYLLLACPKCVHEA